MLRPGRALVALVPAVLVGAALAAPVPVTTEPVKDRKGFVPYRQYEPLPGKAVGVMVADVAPVMSHDGRGGPPDAIAFSRNAGSYRWVYTPATEANPLITGLRVKVGEKGDQVKVYPKLNMANARTLAPWEVAGPVALVAVEVNDGLGAPADEGFVATTMRRVDKTRDYPLDLPKVVADLRTRYAEHKKASQPALDKALAAAQEKWLKDRKPTGPRETQELFYISWLADKEVVRVQFRTKVTDGAYTFVEGGANLDRPFPLPPPPPPKPGLAALPPPPPRFEKVRVGTTFGIEYGLAYDVAKDGEVVRMLELTPEGFGEELPVPPGVGRLGGPRPIDPR